MKAVSGKYYFGGIHPKGQKSLASSSPLEVMPAVEKVAVSVLQSLGKPAIPCVEVGQAVKEGEIIAKADGAISSNVFASIAGVVESIAEDIGASGAAETFITIKSNGSGEKFTFPALGDPTWTYTRRTSYIRRCPRPYGLCRT